MPKPAKNVKMTVSLFFHFFVILTTTIEAPQGSAKKQKNDKEKTAENEVEKSAEINKTA